MEILLVQHGEAAAEEQDPSRPLTDKGKAEVHRLATFLAHTGWRCARIRHSGKLRARQTAELLARDAGRCQVQAHRAGSLRISASSC